MMLLYSIQELHLIIPDSNKPIDLDRSKILTKEDADVAIAWLEEISNAMHLQILRAILDRSPDKDWLAKVTIANAQTLKTTAQVRAMRSQMVRSQKSRAEQFVEAAMELFDEEDLADIWSAVDERKKDGKRKQRDHGGGDEGGGEVGLGGEVVERPDIMPQA